MIPRIVGKSHPVWLYHLCYNISFILDCQLNCTWNHMGGTSLGMSAKEFPERFNWEGKIHRESGRSDSEYGRHHPIDRHTWKYRHFLVCCFFFLITDPITHNAEYHPGKRRTEINISPVAFCWVFGPSNKKSHTTFKPQPLHLSTLQWYPIIPHRKSKFPLPLPGLS